MRKRTKKRILVIGAILVVCFGLFRVLAPKDERPKLAAFSNQWALEDLNWTELFGKHAVSFKLAIIRGEGQVHVNDKTLSAFCGAVLKTLPNPPTADMTAQDVYRIAFNVKNKSGLLYDDDMAITVAEGACVIDPEEAAPYRYPAPLTDWVLRDDTNAALQFLDVLETTFVWSGSGDVELGDFAFDQACLALLTDPPLPLASSIANGNYKQVKVWAEKSIGSGQFHADNVTFDIEGDACVKVAP